MSETIVEYEESNKAELTILEKCKNLKIITSEDFARSAEWYAACVNNIDQIKRRTEKAISEAHQLHKTLCKERNNACAPWESARDRISEERNRYQVEEEEARLEAHRKAEAEAKEKARKEQEALLAKAVKAKTEEKQEELLEKAENVYVEPAFVPSVVEKKIELSFGGSVSSQQDFDVVVTDNKAICRAVVDGKLPVGVIEIKNKALKDAVKLNQIKNGDIEGLRINIKFRNINRK